MSYKIKYVYDTGDSFHTENDRVEYLEAVWDDLEIAKDNLRRIKEHYEYYRYRNHNRDSSSEQRKKLKAFSQKDWFVEKYNFCLKLKLDNEKEFQISAPWCGYFERLNEVEIVTDKSDMKVSFR